MRTKSEKYTLELTEQQLDDLASCVSCTQEHYKKAKPDALDSAKKNPMFMKAVDRLNKKIWKVIRSK